MYILKNSSSNVYGFNFYACAITGVTHKDELVYLFTDPFLSPLNATEIAFSRQMVNVWTNFVKYG